MSQRESTLQHVPLGGGSGSRPVAFGPESTAFAESSRDQVNERAGLWGVSRPAAASRRKEQR
jgi:hypothetical protein